MNFYFFLLDKSLVIYASINLKAMTKDTTVLVSGRLKTRPQRCREERPSRKVTLNLASHAPKWSEALKERAPVLGCDYKLCHKSTQRGAALKERVLVPESDVKLGLH